MPPKIDGDFTTMALVLTVDQADRLRALAQLRSTKLSRTSISEVAREVVEEGLAVILAARPSDSMASRTMASEGEAA